MDTHALSRAPARKRLPSAPHPHPQTHGDRPPRPPARSVPCHRDSGARCTRIGRPHTRRNSALQLRRKLRERCPEAIEHQVARAHGGGGAYDHASCCTVRIGTSHLQAVASVIQPVSIGCTQPQLCRCTVRHGEGGAEPWVAGAPVVVPWQEVGRGCPRFLVHVFDPCVLVARQ